MQGFQSNQDHTQIPRSYTHTLINSYTHTLINLYTYTLIHSYTHTLIHLYTPTHISYTPLYPEQAEPLVPLGYL